MCMYMDDMRDICQGCHVHSEPPSRIIVDESTSQPTPTSHCLDIWGGLMLDCGLHDAP